MINVNLLYSIPISHYLLENKTFSRRPCGGLRVKRGDVNGESHVEPDGEETARQRPGRNPYRKIARRSPAQVNRNRDPQPPHSCPRGAKRSRALTITGNASNDVFANLVRENKPLPVLAAEEIVDLQREAATPATPRLVSSRTSDRNGLQTSLPPRLLHKRLLAIHRDAKTAEEERGVNSLFVALGLLRWTRTKNPTCRATRR
jgi:hypothetical protein